MFRKFTGRSPKVWRGVTVLAVLTGVPILGPGVTRSNLALAQQSASAPSARGLESEEELRKKEQKKYVREHSDPTGKVNPKDYVEGMEHAKRMKVAPYVGAKPLGESTASATDRKSK